MEAAANSSSPPEKAKGKKAAGSTPAKPRPPKPAAAAAGAAARGGGGAEAGGPRGGVQKRTKSKPKARASGGAAEAGAPDEGAVEEAEATTSFRGTFTKDLRALMYGFGDSEVPVKETVDLVEDILVEYLREMTCSAVAETLRLGKLEKDKASGIMKPKIDERDLMFLVRKDARKYSRIRELLEMQVVIANAKKAFDTNKVDTLPEDVDAEAAAAAAEGAAGGGGEAGGLADDLADVAEVDLFA